MEQSKADGVVYTPEPIVNLILDRCHFRQEALRQQRLIDPACGAGAFLLPAVARIINYSQQQGVANRQLSKQLSEQVVGADIDRRALALCRQRLDTLAAERGLPAVDWQLRAGDSLRRSSAWNKEQAGRFDLVIGNPPYVRIQNLGQKRRAQLQRQWPSCQRGAADLFLAFFELGFDLLAPNGYLGYITPRSYFTSEAGAELRELLVNQRRLRQIIDFSRQQIFPEVTTYTAITIAQQVSDASQRRKITIEQRPEHWRRAAWREKIAYQQLADGAGRWLINSSEQRQFIIDCQQRGPTLGEMTEIRVGLATLADSIYLLTLAPEQGSDDRYLTLIDSQGQEQLLERQLLQPICKVSTLKSAEQNQHLWIIFPYQRHRGREVRPFTDSYFRRNFPRGYRYLQTHRQRLAARGHETKQWFEYGSSQGIQTTFGPKILVPPLTLQGQLFLSSNKQMTYFSGYGIFFSGQLPALFQRLQADDFRRYLQLVGRQYRGDYLAINKRLLERFALPASEWQALGAKQSITGS